MKFGVTIISLLLSTLILSIYVIVTVSAQGTVTILSDGSIYPPTAPIVKNPGTTKPFQYYITADMNNPLVIQCSLINIDGANHVLNGGGISVNAPLTEIHNLTITNCNIGIYVLGSGAEDQHSFYNLTLTNNNYGIYLNRTSNVFSQFINNNKIDNCPVAFYLYSAHHVNIENNVIKYSSSTPSQTPIVAYYSDYVTIRKNNITGRNLGTAINIDQSTVSPSLYHTIEGNIISNFTTSLNIHANESLISANNFTNSNNGLTLQTSRNNNITRNYFVNNGVGLSMTGSGDNRIHHNLFLNNTVQVSTTDQYDAFDDGAHGNYWSNYNGVDANRDGIGDTPYTISQFNLDRYPYMSSTTVPELSTIALLMTLAASTFLAFCASKKKEERKTRGK